MARRLRHEELPFLTRAPIRQVHRGQVALPSTAPGIRAFLEAWTLAPVTPDRTELQWLLAADCTRPAALLLRAARRPLGHIFREGTRRMAASSQ